MKKIKYNNRGVTLVELLIVLAIMGIVLQVGYSIFFVGNKSYNISKNKGFAQQDARIVSTVLTNELRTAREVSIDFTHIEQEEYYSLTLKDKKLVKEKYNKDGSEVVLTLANNISEMKINRLPTQEEFLNIEIESEEGADDVNKQASELNLNILLENKPKYNEISNILIKEDVKLYYSKYE